MNLPKYMIDLAKAEESLTRGKVSIELVKNKGEIIGASVNRKNVVLFPQEDIKQVLLLITQKLKELERGEGETELEFKIDAKDGRIKKMHINEGWRVS